MQTEFPLPEGFHDKERALRQQIADLEREHGPYHESLIDPLLDLGVHILVPDRIPESEALTRRVIDLQERNKVAVQWVQTQRFLVHLLKLQHKYDEALDLLKIVLSIHREAYGLKDVDTAGVMGELAEVYDRMGRAPKARRLFLRARRIMREVAEPLDEDVISLLFAQGEFENRHGGYERAIRLFRTVLRRCRRVEDEDLDHIQHGAEQGLSVALGLRAYQLIEERKWQEAFNAAREMADLSPSMGLRTLGEVCRRMESPEQAMRLLNEAIQAEPSAALWTILGDLHHRAGAWKEAEHAYEQALVSFDACSCSSRIHFHAGVNLHMQARIPEALVHLEKVRRDEADLYYKALGMRMALLKHVGRADDAAALAREVLGEMTGPRRIEGAAEAASLLCLGRALLYARGDAKAALACALQSYRKDRDMLSLGLVREIQARPAASAKWFTMLVQIDREGADPVLRAYTVVADTEEEALWFIRVLEGDGEDEGGSALDLTVVRISAEDPKGKLDLKGVIQVPELLEDDA